MQNLNLIVISVAVAHKYAQFKNHCTRRKGNVKAQPTNPKMLKMKRQHEKLKLSKYIKISPRAARILVGANKGGNENREGRSGYGRRREQYSHPYRVRIKLHCVQQSRVVWQVHRLCQSRSELAQKRSTSTSNLSI